MAKTIRDVAEEAGVSIATVSRVINKTNKVKPETRSRVMKAAEKLHFYPDQGARSMVSKKTKSVGLLVPTPLRRISRTLRHVHLPAISFGQALSGFSSVWGDPCYREEHDRREMGFREALTRAGITINEKLVECVPFSIEKARR